MIKLDSAQSSAVDSLRPGSILVGGVGSGKSITALAFFFVKVLGGQLALKPGQVYQPAQKSVDLYIITTAAKRDKMEWEAEMANLAIHPDNVPYKIVVDSWNNLPKYSEVEDSFFILDEQRLVGSGAWAKAFFKIAKSNKWILLSATPGDTWLDYATVFVANGFYKNRTEFKRQHVMYDNYVKFPRVRGYVGTKKLATLRKSILVELPVKRHTKRHYIRVNVDYDREKYRHLYKDRWNIYDNVPIVDAAELVRLSRKLISLDHSRRDELVKIVKERKKVIIFYNFNYELEMLRELFDGVTVFREWNGQKHEDLPTGDEWVYLVQYTAGAEGWNCTTADTIVFYSYTYSYKHFEQASGRIDRRNTPFTDLYYYQFDSKAPIELAIRRAIMEKKDFNERAFIKNL